MISFLNKITTHETEKIKFAAFIIAVSSFLSFLLGLLRDRLLSSTFGVGNTLDAYYMAFRIPDFVALVLMMGAISVAIVPIFTQNLVENKEKAFKYLANFLNVATVILVVICAILFIFAPILINLIAPGFLDDKKEITVMLTRIMFLSPILLGISNIISAVLMVFKRFLITSLAPVVYNLGSIVGIIFFVPMMGIQGLAWGIVLGAFLHLLIQIPSLSSIGFKLQPSFNIVEKDFLQTIKLTIPRAIGLTAAQINFIIITAVGSTLLVGSVTIFNWANDLSAPIVGLIAIPFATAVFPALSLAVSKNNREEFLNQFYLAFRQILFLIIPASAISFLLRAHMVRIVFGTNMVDWTSTRLTAACFGIFMFALAAQGLVYLVSKAFYAIRNTVIPTVVSLVSIATLPVLAYWFIHLLRYENVFANLLADFLRVQDIPHFQIIGLPLAIAVDSIIQIILLLLFLKMKVKEIQYRHFTEFFVKVVLATTLTVFVSYTVRQIFGGLLGSTTFFVMLLQTAIVGLVAIVVYYLAAKLLQLPEVSTFSYFLNRLPGVKKPNNTNESGTHS